MSAPPVDAEAATHRAYDALAAHYDRFWGDRMTPFALRALGEMVLPRLALPVERDPRVLDLCCGSGQLAATLAARGWDVVGLDASAGLLDRARAGAPRARFVRADARDLTAPEVVRATGETPFDVVVSAFDSLNHLLDPVDLAAVFRGIHARLRPGGALLFDLNAPRGFRQRFRGGFDLDDGELACRVEASFDAATGIGRYRVHVRQVDGVAVAGGAGTTSPGPSDAQAAPLELLQRCHARRDVVAMLEDAGFESIAVHDAERALGMAGHAGREVYVAWRAG